METENNICYLSGLAIPSLKYLSREHFLPISRAPAFLTRNPYNIHPAIKIINSIKGNLTPCEWQDKRIKVCAYALKNYNLRTPEKKLVKKVIEIYKNMPPEDICLKCVCERFKIFDYCPQKYALDKVR